MWIVRNVLRGTLVFKGLLDREPLRIKPGEEFDLDLLGRERAEASNQIAVAMEEGYLQVVRRDTLSYEAGGRSGMSEELLDRKLDAFKTSILERLDEVLPASLAEADLRGALAEMRSSVVGDMQDMLKNLRVAKLKLQAEKDRVLLDTTLSEAEIQARLGFLEEKEQEIEKNFRSIGVKSGPAESGDILSKAEELSDLL